MRASTIFKNLALTLLLTLAGSGTVNANLASGPQNLGLDLHQAASWLEPAPRLGWSDSSYDVAPESPVATRGGASAVRVGRAGEDAVRAVFDIGPKELIRINGRGRIPDGFTTNTLSEVKNVQSLSFTRQLRDFADFSEQTGRSFDLFVRPGAKLSQPLLDARTAGRINIREIPF